MPDAHRNALALMASGCGFNALFCARDSMMVAQVLEPGLVEKELLPKPWVLAVLQEAP